MLASSQAEYWPHLELVGTFHSHPYESLEEMKNLAGPGWKASDGDKDHWPEIHKQIAPDQPSLAHLIVTITELSKRGWALPEKFKDKNCDGYSFVTGYKKLWLTAYATHEAYTEEESRVFDLTEGVTLDASSLTTRMIQNN
ncbi:hypothetical protein [Rheinheimera oceanensis]|uniref:hypothetical protein n=1 Tax=Rheinheimera oceanensis TaxID=2817449 RepID=UPI001BFCE59A|nr:hypothetical protein [Rheinheimera oceanensis]